MSSHMICVRYFVENVMNHEWITNHFVAICFLDRDGTINLNTGYPHRCEELHILDHAAKGIHMLNQNRVLVVVVTNQSGIGRKYFGISDMQQFHRCIEKELAKEDAHIDLWRYCPHHPDDDCTCRKPKTGMVDDLVSCHPDSLFFVGDSKSDMQCAKNVGAVPLAIRGTPASLESDVSIVSDLLDASKRIILSIKLNNQS